MQYMIADERNPNMGLNNKPCQNPKYWCRLHQVWLSEEDVEKKHCKNKTDVYMLETVRCTNLVSKDFIKRNLRKLKGDGNGTDNQQRDNNI